MQAQGRGTTKFTSRELAPNNNNFNGGLSSTNIDRAGRNAAIASHPQTIANNGEVNDGRYRFRGRSFERATQSISSLASSTTSNPAPPSVFSNASSNVSLKGGRNRSRGRTSTPSVAPATNNYEPLTRSRKARVFQEQRNSDIEAIRTRTTRRDYDENNASVINGKKPLRNLHDSSPKKSSHVDQIIRSEGFQKVRGRQRTATTAKTPTTVTMPNFKTSTAKASEHSSQPQRDNRLGFSRHGRRFNTQKNNGNASLNTTTIATPRATSTESLLKNRSSPSSRTAKFLRIPNKDNEPLPEFINSAIYDQNYPDHFKMLFRIEDRNGKGSSEILTSSRRIDSNTDSLERAADTNIEKEFRSIARFNGNQNNNSPIIDKRYEPSTTTPRNRYTTRQNYKFSLPAFKRISTTTTARSNIERENYSGFSPSGHGSNPPKKFQPKFIAKSFTNQAIKSSSARQAGPIKRLFSTSSGETSVRLFFQYKYFGDTNKFSIFRMKIPNQMNRRPDEIYQLLNEAQYHDTKPFLHHQQQQHRQLPNRYISCK